MKHWKIKNEKFLLDIQTKCGDITDEILNAAIDAERSFKCKWPDVVGLYPHIPHDQGVEFMRCFLGKREDQSVSSESLCKLANTVLKHNYFGLRKDVYHQILGTAIGTNLLHTMLTYLWLVWKKRYLKNLTFNPIFGCGIYMIFSAYGLEDLKIWRSSLGFQITSILL